MNFFFKKSIVFDIKASFFATFDFLVKMNLVPTVVAENLTATEICLLRVRATVMNSSQERHRG